MPQILAKIVLSILMKLVTEEAITDLFLWAAKSIASKTKTPIDDELVAIIEKHLESK